MVGYLTAEQNTVGEIQAEIQRRKTLSVTEVGFWLYFVFWTLIIPPPQAKYRPKYRPKYGPKYCDGTGLIQDRHFSYILNISNTIDSNPAATHDTGGTKVTQAVSHWQ